MKKLIILSLSLILFTALVCADSESSHISYTDSTSDGTLDISGIEIKFIANDDLTIDRIKVIAREGSVDFSIITQDLSNPINSFDMAGAECIATKQKQVLSEVNDKQILYGPTKVNFEYGWNYITIEKPVFIKRGTVFFIEFVGGLEIDTDSSNQQIETTFVSQEINGKQYIGAVKDVLCGYRRGGKIVNAMVEINPLETSRYKCEDTDKLNFNIKGQTSVSVDGLPAHSKTDYCSGDIKTLMEAYCINDSEIGLNEHECEGICSEGACVIPTICPAKINIRLNKNIFLVNERQKISINTYDSENKAIDSIIDLYLYKNNELLQSGTLNIPKKGFDFDSREAAEDIKRLDAGAYRWEFKTSVPGCTTQMSKSFEIKESMNLWEKFVNFVRGLVS